MAGNDNDNNNSLSLSLFLAHLPIVIHFVVDTDLIFFSPAPSCLRKFRLMYLLCLICLAAVSNCLLSFAALFSQLVNFSHGKPNKDQCKVTDVEQYLQIYCNYQQDNWSKLLPLMEFA